MTKVKRYSVPLVLGIIAVALLAVGILALTIWRPAQQVSASHESTEPFTMTRAGVLPLYADRVSIRATADEDQDVWLAVGSAEDITAWLQDEPYEEVVGLSNLQTLKTIPHGVEAGAQSGEAAPSEEVESAQSGGQATSPITSDMWIAENYGRGSVSLTLSGEDMGLSILAATDGAGPAPTLTLTWQTPRPNLLALVSFIGAGVAAVLGLVVAVALAGAAKRRTARSEELRTLGERANTDTAEIAMLADSSAAEDVPVTEEPEAAETLDEGQEQEPAVAEDIAIVAEETQADESQQEEVRVDEEEDSDPASAMDPQGLAGEVGIAAEEKAQDPGDVKSQEESANGDDVHEARLAASRSETVTTDSGMMNLSALQASGGAFPTRRALRDAHRRGVSRLVVGEREFATTGDDEQEDPTPDQVLRERTLRPNKWSEAMGDVEQ